MTLSRGDEPTRCDGLDLEVYYFVRVSRGSAITNLKGVSLAHL